MKHFKPILDAVYWETNREHTRVNRSLKSEVRKTLNASKVNNFWNNQINTVWANTSLIKHL